MHVLNFNEVSSVSGGVIETPVDLLESGAILGCGFATGLLIPVGIVAGAYYGAPLAGEAISRGYHKACDGISWCYRKVVG